MHLALDYAQIINLSKSYRFFIEGVNIDFLHEEVERDETVSVTHCPRLANSKIC